MILNIVQVLPTKSFEVDVVLSFGDPVFAGIILAEIITVMRPEHFGFMCGAFGDHDGVEWCLSKMSAIFSSRNGSNHVREDSMFTNSKALVAS